MYKFKIWDKKEPINGCPADKVMENRWDLQTDDVILIYQEKNPYRILYIETGHGPLFEMGDTLDMTAQRQCNILEEQEILNSQQPKGPVEVVFSEEQMTLVQEMIQDAVQQATQEVVSQMSATMRRANPVE